MIQWGLGWGGIILEFVPSLETIHTSYLDNAGHRPIYTNNNAVLSNCSSKEWLWPKKVKSKVLLPLVIPKERSYQLGNQTSEKSWASSQSPQDYRHNIKVPCWDVCVCVRARAIYTRNSSMGIKNLFLLSHEPDCGASCCLRPSCLLGLFHKQKLDIYVCSPDSLKKSEIWIWQINKYSASPKGVHSGLFQGVLQSC